jgi:uncharacterized cupin superfamily protein
MTVKPPALDPASLETVHGSAYPPPYDKPARGRSRKLLGDALGLTQFGVRLTTLAPGAISSHRHWHTAEDEFVFVLEGAPTLITDEGEQILRPGLCAGFVAGVANGHHLVNRTTQPVRYLEFGTRAARDEAFFSEADLHFAHDAGGRRFTRSDGTPYGREGED